MNRTTRSRLAVLVLLFCVITPVCAFGQDLTADEIEEFKALTVEGAELYEEGEYEASIDRLRRAREIYPHPDLDYNIGRAQARLHQCAAARQSFEDYLERDDISDDDVTQAREQLAELESCKAFGRVSFTCNVPARVSVNDAEKQTDCPGELRLLEGEHTSFAAANGYETTRRTFTVKSGERLVVQFDLEERDRGTPSTDRGSSWQSWAGWGGVGVGGALVITGFFVDAGAQGRLNELQDASQERDGERLAELRDRSRRARTTTIVLYSVGGAVAALGATLLLVELGRGGDDTVRLGVGPDGVRATLRW